MIGEPWWSARTAQQSTEWARYESLLNAALAWANVALVCAYDIGAYDIGAYDIGVVGLDVVAEVARTHPELVVDGGIRPSLSYLDPAVFNAECDSSPLPELPSPALWFRFDQVDQLVTLRDFVTSHATQAGAAVLDVTQFVQAVYSVATNTIEHGGGSGVVRVWADPHAMVCEVSDTGAGLGDPLVGRLPSGRSTART